jgi:hypothetical protein
VFTTNGTYPLSFVTQIFHNGQPRYDGDHEHFRSDEFNLSTNTV